ncbi:MAG: hypothetical protein ABI999_12385, partial [Acidobacteriota bacterium]
MESSNNQGNQTRFITAAVLCMLVLFGWSYFFAPKPKPADNSNTATNANTASVAQSTPAPQIQEPSAVTSTPDNTPNRSITIKSPLYQVTLDSRGAVATSWILIRNKTPKEDRPLWADGSTDAARKPLELISPEALAKTPREVPFRLSTDDPNVNALINDRNYSVSEGGETIQLADGQEKQIDFTLTDASGVEVKK